MDKRFVLAVRYHEAGLDAEAWPLLKAMLAEPAPPAEAVVSPPRCASRSRPG